MKLWNTITKYGDQSVMVCEKCSKKYNYQVSDTMTADEANSDCVCDYCGESELPAKIKHTFKFENVGQVNDCLEYWKSEVTNWSRIKMTVTVKAGETEIRQYEAHASEIHGWSE